MCVCVCVRARARACEDPVKKSSTVNNHIIEVKALITTDNSLSIRLQHSIAKNWAYSKFITPCIY